MCVPSERALGPTASHDLRQAGKAPLTRRLDSMPWSRYLQKSTWFSEVPERRPQPSPLLQSCLVEGLERHQRCSCPEKGNLLFWEEFCAHLQSSGSFASVAIPLAA